MSKSSQACVDCFKSLGVPTRYKIYAYLKGHENVTVTELVDLVGLRQPTVSYHLKDMQDHGLLTSAKKGKEVYYSVNEICPSGNAGCVLNTVGFQKVDKEENA